MNHLRPDPDHPDPDELEFDELVRELLRLLGGPIAMPDPEEHRDTSETWLPKSWLARALARERRHRNRGWEVVPSSARQRLVALLNRLDADDVEYVLNAEDPRVEVEAVYRGVLALEREAAEQKDDGPTCADR